MFDVRNDPKHLLESLRRFLRHWYHSEKPWYWIGREKLDATSLPEPLRDLYSFAGDWPGQNLLVSAFGYRDYVVAFELLTAVRGKLVFAWESEGGPIFGTETKGDDPPVWASQDNAPWQLVCESLAQFIVTMCLRETTFGGKHQTGHGDLLGFANTAGLHVSPLWLNGPFIGGPNNFYLIDSEWIVLDNLTSQWGSTQSDTIAQRFSDLFPKPQTGRKTTRDAAIHDKSIPLFFRQTVARSAMREHREQADHHAAKADAYRRIVEELGTDTP